MDDGQLNRRGWRRAHRVAPELLARLSGRRHRPFVFRACNALIRGGLRALRIRVTVKGAHNVPNTGGVIVAFNHLSVADPPLVAVCIERHAGRRVRFMAKAEAMRWPVLGRLFRAYGGFGVERGRLDRDAYRTARAVLESEDWLGLAPEGTRSRTGTMGDAHTGAVLLAIRSGALILPLGLTGSERVWPIGAPLPRPRTRATVRIGEPYRPATRDAEAETQDLMRRIAALLPPAYRGERA